jgi:hypothetical protein
MVAATTVAEQHWHRKGSKHPPFSRERARCYAFADDFKELHDTLLNERAAEERA